MPPVSSATPHSRADSEPGDVLLIEQVDREGTPTDAFAHAPDHVISEAAWDDFGATYEPEPGR